MRSDRIRELIRRLQKMLSGYSECRGIFCVVDREGNSLAEVEVFYCVGEGEWVAAGRSRRSGSTQYSVGWGQHRPNYIQPSLIFYRIGEPVTWRFRKPGYHDAKVTRYTAGISVDGQPQIVSLMPVYERACYRA